MSPELQAHIDAAKTIRDKLNDGSLSLATFRADPLAVVEHHGGTVAATHRETFNADFQALLEEHGPVDLTTVPGVNDKVDGALAVSATQRCLPCEIFLGTVVAGVEVATALGIYAAVLAATGAATEGVGAVILAILESDAYWAIVGGVIMATAPEIGKVLCVDAFKCAGG